MAITRVQYKSGQGSGSPINVSFDSSVTAGSLLLCCVNSYQSGTEGFSVSDNQSNSWVKLFENNYQNNDVAGIAYAYNAAAGSTTVTVTATGSGPWWTIVIVEVSGIATSSALDQSNSATGSGTDPDSGNITTTQADEYLIGCFAQDDSGVTITEDSPWTLIYEYENQPSNMPISVIERIVSSTLTESAGWTLGSSVDWFAGVGSFKGTGAPGGLSIPVAMHHRRQQGMS